MPAITSSKFMVQAGWDDVPHLDTKTKTELIASTPPYLRDARTKGTPSLGSGAIYPVEDEVFLVDAFQLPAHWPRIYALDVGWNRTAALWGAVDRESSTTYLYAEHYRSQAEPSIHAASIRARGHWIPGVIDPAARGRSQVDGARLMSQYQELGLILTAAENSVESGIFAVWELLSTGRLKVFKNLSNWRAEHKLYRRDEKGNIVKKFDHLMDTTRYLVVSGLSRAIVQPVRRIAGTSGGLVVADSTGGY